MSHRRILIRNNGAFQWLNWFRIGQVLKGYRCRSIFLGDLLVIQHRRIDRLPICRRRVHADREHVARRLST
jgi:hypothetical protein